jgi:hypothetical protein
LDETFYSKFGILNNKEKTLFCLDEKVVQYAFEIFMLYSFLQMKKPYYKSLIVFSEIFKIIESYQYDIGIFLIFYRKIRIFY